MIPIYLAVDLQGNCRKLFTSGIVQHVLCEDLLRNWSCCLSMKERRVQVDPMDCQDPQGGHQEGAAVLFTVVWGGMIGGTVINYNMRGSDQ